MDKEEFSKKFESRQADFIKAISSLAEGNNFSWVNYINEHIIEDDGFVSHIAKRDNDSSSSDDLESFQNYIRFLSGQGLTVEINVEWSLGKIIFHVASWEDEDEIEWPEQLNSSYIFRWVPVSGPENLGIL